MTIGIYYLEVNNKFYIGQSVNIEKRFQEHKRTLDKNEHFNYKIQEAYNRYPESLVMGIITLCNSEELNSLEIEYINEFNTIEEGYNLTNGGDCGDRHGENHPCSKYSNEQVLQAAVLLAEANLTLLEISSITGISNIVLSMIANGKLHNWLEEKCPETYLKLVSVNRYKLAASKRKSSPIKVKPFMLENKKLGIIERVEVVADFARKYNIFNSRGNLTRLKDEVRAVQSVKGWTLYKEPV